MLKRFLKRVRSSSVQRMAQQQQSELPKRAHGWQTVRPVNAIGENGEILRLEICIGCNAQRCTARYSDGQIHVLATDPAPLPPFCAKRFDTPV